MEPVERVLIGKQVSNLTAIEERAKWDLKDVIDVKKPHVPISIKGTKVGKLTSVKQTTVKATSTQKKCKSKEPEDELTIFNKKSRK